MGALNGMNSIRSTTPVLYRIHGLQSLLSSFTEGTKSAAETGTGAFPSGSGRQLGGHGAIAAAGPTRRAVGVDARTARLKALEGNKGKDGDEVV